MKNREKVTIITRTKNRPLLLDRAIKSVMGQSFDDFLMVIVNDGGDEEQIKALAAANSEIIKGRLKIISNKESQGMQAAANTALNNTDSEYIALLDDDDTWEPEFLETTINFLEKTQHYKGVVTAASVVKETINDNIITTISKERFAPFIHYISYFSELGINQFPNNSFVFSREAQRQVGDFSQAVDVLGDWDFNVRFMAQYDVAFIDTPLANYHQRSTQGAESNSINSDSHSRYTAEILNKSLREELGKKELGPGFVANLSNSMHRTHMDLKQEIALLGQSVINKEELDKRLLALEQRIEELEVSQREIIRQLDHRLGNLPRRVARKTQSYKRK